jgi:hypothetical protein
VGGGDFGFPFLLGFVKTIFLQKRGKITIFWRKTAILDLKKDWDPSPDLFSS